MDRHGQMCDATWITDMKGDSGKVKSKKFPDHKIGEWLVEVMRSGKLVKWHTFTRMGCADEIVFRESKTNGFKSTRNFIGHSILDTIIQIEVDSLWENNSLDNSAWTSHTKYRKDV